MENLADYHLSPNPIECFDKWHEKAQENEEAADAFALATVAADGTPRVRYLLYKGLFDRQLAFYTHYTSPKAEQMSERPCAEMAFYWPRLGRQVRVRGKVIKMSEEDSQKYFSSRGFESQVASFISKQSTEIESRAALEKNFEEAKHKFKEGGVPYPKTWGGYLLQPSEVEFFLYGDFRLNDRFLFESKEGQWSWRRLQP